jgi:hypothetical protein
MKFLRKLLPKKDFKDANQVLAYCLSGECPNDVLGCALTCKLREKWGIPPYGEKYPVDSSKKVQKVMESGAQ